jgi:predicted transcriptional regulator
MNTTEIVRATPLERVRQALAMYADFRTVGGIARDTGLTRTEVRRVIDANPTIFEKAPMEIGGEPVFVLRTQRDMVLQ